MFLLVFAIGCQSEEKPTATTEKAPVKKKVAPALTALDYFGMLPNPTFNEVLTGMSDDTQHSLVNDGSASGWKITTQNADRIEIQKSGNAQEKVILQVYPKDAGSPLVGVEITGVDAEGEKIEATTFWSMNPDTRLLSDAGGVLPDVSANDYFSSALPEDMQPDISFHLKDATTIQTKVTTWDDPEFQNKKVVNDIQFVWNGNTFDLRKTAK